MSIPNLPVWPLNDSLYISLEEFALLEASYATVRLLQTFGTIEPERHSNGNSVFNDRKSVTLVAASRDGCRVVLE